MANVPDLIMDEVAAEVLDQDLKTWLLGLAPLPTGVGIAEFFAKTFNAAYVAQSKKNTAANAVTPLAPGEALAAYNAPNPGQVTTNIATGILTFPATYSVTTVSAIDLDSTVPSRA